MVLLRFSFKQTAKLKVFYNTTLNKKDLKLEIFMKKIIISWLFHPYLKKTNHIKKI